MKKFVAFLVVCLPLTAIFGQSEKLLDFEIKEKKADNIRVRTMTNGDFLVFATKFRNYGKNSTTCVVFDANGNKKGSYKDKKLSVYIDKYTDDNEMTGSNGSIAFKQINETRIFSPEKGKMYLFINATKSLIIKETDPTGKQINYKFHEDLLLRSAQLISWDVKELEGNIIRSLFTYNHADPSKITIVALDFNTQNKSIKAKSMVFEQGLVGFAGHDRPHVSMIEEFTDNRIFCAVRAGRNVKFCIFNDDLTENYTDNQVIIAPERARIAECKLLTHTNKGASLVGLIFRYTVNEGSAEYQYYVTTKSCDLVSLNLDEYANVPFEINYVKSINKTVSFESQENYEGRFHLQATSLNEVMIQCKTDVRHYEVIGKKQGLTAVFSGTYPMNYGSEILNFGSDESKKQFCEDNIYHKGVVGYCYVHDNLSERLLLVSPVDGINKIKLYTW